MLKRKLLATSPCKSPQLAPPVTRRKTMGLERAWLAHYHERVTREFVHNSTALWRNAGFFISDTVLQALVQCVVAHYEEDSNEARVRSVLQHAVILMPASIGAALDQQSCATRCSRTGIIVPTDVIVTSYTITALVLAIKVDTVHMDALVQELHEHVRCKPVVLQLDVINRCGWRALVPRR